MSPCTRAIASAMVCMAATGTTSSLAPWKAQMGTPAQLHGEVGIAAAAHRRDGGEALGVGRGEGPGAEAAHAEAGDVDAARVDAVAGHGVVQQRVEAGHHQLAVPAPARRTLRRQDDRRHLAPRRQFLRQAVDLHAVQLVAALARAVQEEDERPGAGGVVVVARRQVERGDAGSRPGRRSCVKVAGCWRSAAVAPEGRQTAHRHRRTKRFMTTSFATGERRA